MELSTKPQNNEYPYTHRTANNSMMHTKKTLSDMYTMVVHHIIIIMIFWSMLTFFPWAEIVSYFGWYGGQKTAIKVNQDDSHQCIEKREFFNLNSALCCPQEHSILNALWWGFMFFCIISRICTCLSFNLSCH
jgi:hypothetical protein